MSKNFFENIKNLPNFREVDLLDVSEVPANQKYFVIGYVEPVPSLLEVAELHAFKSFIEHAGKSVALKCLEDENYGLLFDKYETYKTANFEKLQNKFVKEFGNYGKYRMLKIYRGFHTEKEANEYINDLKNDGTLDGDVYIQHGGHWSLYRPPPELCNKVNYGNDIMNDLMGAHKLHKKQMKMRLKDRKRVMIEKAMKDRDAAGAGSMKFHTSSEAGGPKEEVVEKGRILSDDYIERRYKELDPTDLFKLTDDPDDQKLLREWLQTEIAVDGGVGVNIELAKRLLPDADVQKILKAKQEFKRKNEEEAKKNEARNKKAEVETRIQNSK